MKPPKDTRKAKGKAPKKPADKAPAAKGKGKGGVRWPMGLPHSPGSGM